MLKWANLTWLILTLNHVSIFLTLTLIFETRQK